MGVIPMDSSSIHDYFNKLEKTISSYERLKKSQPVHFNEEEGVFQAVRPDALPDWGEEVERANRFLNRKIAVITEGAGPLEEYEDRIHIINLITKNITKKLEKSKESNPSQQAAIKALKSQAQALTSKIAGVQLRSDEEISDEEISDEVISQGAITPERLILDLQIKGITPGDFLKKMKPFVQQEAPTPSVSDLTPSSEDESTLPISDTHEEEIKGLGEEELKKIQKYYEKNRKKILKQAKAKNPKLYLRKEITKLPVTIQVRPETDEGPYLLIHVREKRGTEEFKKIRKGEGEYKKISLAAGLNPERDVTFYATATPLTEDQNENFYREIEFLKRFQGEPGIVQLVTHCAYPVKTGKHKKSFQRIRKKLFKEKLKPNMVMTYAESDLKKTLAKGKLDEADRKKKTLELLQGVRTIHAKNVVHHDLKPANILISGDSVMISDFGLARTEDDTSSDRVRGNPLYLAPEIWQAMDNEGMKGLIDTKADVFSLGVILYQMITQTLPVDVRIIQTFNDPGNRHLIPQLIAAWHASETEALASEEPSELAIILNMLHPDQGERITAREAYKEFRALYAEESTEIVGDSPP